MGRLDKVDLSRKLDEREYEERLLAAQRRLAARRLQLGGRIGDRRPGPPVCIVFEGWDASGKGGCINRLTGLLDHRHVRVVGFGPPTEDEKRHHYLWRFQDPLPGWGGMSVYDRSWYGRVLVERVEGLATKEQWRRAYTEIVEFERFLAGDGMILVKFWLHISEKEQLRRFRHREREPLKRWKLTEEDWRNREKRGAYTEAVEAMLEHTDHPDAPWDVVPAEHKKYGRVHVIETAIARIEEGMKARGFRPLTDKELEAA